MKNNPVNTDLPLFCPREGCVCYQSYDNKITKDGMYKTKYDTVPRQMYYCHGGGHRHSETGYSDFFGKHGSFKEYEQAAKLITHGLSADAAADVFERDVRTVVQWLSALGNKGQHLHCFLRLHIGISILSLQMDELWSYLKCKSRQLWVFTALESDTEFWINFELGSRTVNTACRLVKGLRHSGRWGDGHILRNGN